MRFGFRELVFFVVLLAVPLASYLYVFKPRNVEIKQAEVEVEIKKERLQKLEQVAATIDDLELAIERGRQSIEVIEAKLPSKKEEEVILEQVWRLAEKNGLIVKSFHPEKSVSAALYMETPLKIVMEGQFDGFYEFELQLESLPRITRIHDMKLERLVNSDQKGSEITPGSMRAEFTLSIFFEADAAG